MTATMMKIQLSSESGVDSVCHERRTATILLRELTAKQLPQERLREIAFRLGVALQPQEKQTAADKEMLYLATENDLGRKW